MGHGRWLPSFARTRARRRAVVVALLTGSVLATRSMWTSGPRKRSGVRAGHGRCERSAPSRQLGLGTDIRSVDSDQRADEIAKEFGEERIVTCLPFMLEAGYSARNCRRPRRAFDELGSLDFLPIDLEVERRALDAQAQLAQVGHHRVPPVDLLIAALADRHSVGVLHYDSDYDVLLEKTDLDFHSEWLVPRGSSESLAEQGREAEGDGVRAGNPCHRARGRGGNVLGSAIRRSPGGVPEWLNGTVSKTVDVARRSWVRIPPPPPSSRRVAAAQSPVGRSAGHSPVRTRS